MAAKGYPGNYAKGSVINGLDHLPETSKSMCFHAGTTQTETAITATGGRVLNITARAESLRALRARRPILRQSRWIGQKGSSGPTLGGGHSDFQSKSGLTDIRFAFLAFARQARRAHL